MTFEERQEFLKIFPLVDECPACHSLSETDDLEAIKEFCDIIKDGKLEWFLIATSPTFSYHCKSCGKKWIRSRHGQGPNR